MFRNKCAKCEKIRSKCRFIGQEGKSLCRKCFNKVNERVREYIILLLSFQMSLEGNFANSIGVHIAFTCSWHGCV